MPTIRLKVSDKIYERLMDILKGFGKDEVEIIREDPEFETNKAYLKSELKEIDKGEAEFYSEEEVDERLTNTIRKHEDQV